MGLGVDHSVVVQVVVVLVVVVLVHDLRLGRQVHLDLGLSLVRLGLVWVGLLGHVPWIRGLLLLLVGIRVRNLAWLLRWHLRHLLHGGLHWWLLLHWWLHRWLLLEWWLLKRGLRRQWLVTLVIILIHLLILL